MPNRTGTGSPPVTRAYDGSAYELEQRKASRQQYDLERPAAHLMQPKRRNIQSSKRRIQLGKVAEVLEMYGLDPTVEIIRTLKDPKSNLSAELRLRTYTQLMEYVHAKKKSVELTGKDGGPIRLETATKEELLRIATQEDVVDVEARAVEDGDQDTDSSDPAAGDDLDGLEDLL